ncbi:hypothetical protein GJ744_002061 [Endocarpon pusillum]|uniref:DUF4219 domain-containing protein n=1 Tax=Endocarpon pusillum TaxID=364733 RepID=A0A8H7E2W9_9EURO|nr:hypothetical protein GJ744_002061 [Endocarpon pusillum]
MRGSTDSQRPKHPVLTGKDNWSTWSKGFFMYLKGKELHDVLSDNPIPLNPSTLIGEIGNDHVKEYILDTKEIEEDKITAQKISANKRKVRKALQAKFDEWQERNDEALSEIYYGCSTAIQGVIDNHTIAKQLWTYLEKSYSSAGMATIDSELLKLEDLSYANSKNVQHLVSTLNKSKETLTGLGFQTSESYWIHILLKGLGPSFSALARDIRQRDLNKLTFDDCAAQAYTEEMSVRQQDTSSTTASAMNVSKGKDKGKGKGNDKSKDTQSSDKKKPQGNFYYNNCGPKSTHPSSNCFYLHPEKIPPHLKDRFKSKPQGNQQANKQQELTPAELAATQLSNLTLDQLPDALKKQLL